MNPTCFSPIGHRCPRDVAPVRISHSPRNLLSVINFPFLSGLFTAQSKTLSSFSILFRSAIFSNQHWEEEVEKKVLFFCKFAHSFLFYIYFIWSTCDGKCYELGKLNWVIDGFDLVILIEKNPEKISFF